MGFRVTEDARGIESARTRVHPLYQGSRYRFGPAPYLTAVGIGSFFALDHRRLVRHHGLVDPGLALVHHDTATGRALADQAAVHTSRSHLLTEQLDDEGTEHGRDNHRWDERGQYVDQPRRKHR